MKTRCVLTAMLILFGLNGCAAESSRVTEYLSGFQALPVPPSPSLQAVRPLAVGLVLVLPEAEIGKPTTPAPAVLDKVARRVQKELGESSGIVIQQVLPPITIPGGGRAGLSLERLRILAGEAKLDNLLVVVATSRSAQKLRFWPVMEYQLYVNMDAALVDVPKGVVLLTELGQNDYVMADVLDYTMRISYPRLYYRDFTFGGPFTIVEGDPYQALGWETFKGAADQLGMKLRQRWSPEGVS